MARIDEIRTDCPFCGSPDHFYFNTVKTAWICFSCGKSGRGVRDNFKGVLAEAKRFRQRARRGGTVFSFSPPRSSSQHRLPDDFKPFSILEHDSDTVVRGLGLNGAAVLRYLQRRGLTETEMLRYRIGFGILTAIFPIYDDTEVNLLTYWVARRIKPREGEPRYLNAPWSRHGSLFASSIGSLLACNGPLMHKRSVKKSLQTRVIVEGVLDAILLGRRLPTVSTLGKMPNRDDFKRLQEMGVKRLVFCFDPDATGMAIEAAKEALSWIRHTHVHRLEGGDPAELWLELGQELLKYW